MRKISGVSVAQFSTLMGLEALTAIAGAKYLVMPWVGEDFRGIAAVAAAILFFYMLAILASLLVALTVTPALTFLFFRRGAEILPLPRM